MTALRPRREQRRDRLDRHAPRVGLDVDEDRRGADVGDRRRGGDPRRLGHDDLVAGTDAEGQQAEVQPGRARRQGDGVSAARWPRRTPPRTPGSRRWRARTRSCALALATASTSRSVIHGPATGIVPGRQPTAVAGRALVSHASRAPSLVDRAAGHCTDARSPASSGRPTPGGATAVAVGADMLWPCRAPRRLSCWAA